MKLYPRLLLLVLLGTMPCIPRTVTCTGKQDAKRIQASLNEGGTTNLVGACNIGNASLQTVVDGTILTTTSGASITSTYNGYHPYYYALTITHNNVKITGLIWNGGGIITSQNSHQTPQHDIMISGNTFQNIATGADAILGSGYWLRVAIASNVFRKISSVPIELITSATNVENGVGGYVCNYPAANANVCGGSGIENNQGMDHSSITDNVFDGIIGDGVHISYNWALSSDSSDYTTAKDNVYSFNKFTRIHRIAIESQGSTGACPGPKGCNYAHYLELTGFKINGNYAYGFIGSYGDTYFLSIPIGTREMQVVNNSGIEGDRTCTANSFCPGYAIEQAGDNGVYQGNVLSVSAGTKNWGTYFMTGSSQAKTTNQNNIMNGSDSPNYYGCEPAVCPGQSGIRINQFNKISAACPVANACETSNLVVGSNLADRDGRNVTMSVYAVDEISLKWVQFFMDDSPEPQSTQQIQDLNTAFDTDGRWLYHYSFRTSEMKAGVHSIKAIATDVSGATQATTQRVTLPLSDKR
jgi:hypothetical protein